MRKGKESFILGAISLVANEISAYCDKFFKDITYKQWFLLTMISKMKEEENNVNDIADFAGSSRQNVKKMLSALEAKGYVTLVKSKADGRALSVKLTDKTYKYFYDNNTGIANGTGKLFSDFDDADIETLKKSLQKLLTALEG